MSDLAAFLERLRVLPLEVRARARESIELPAFAGSSLRGAFGHALKDVGCVVEHRECERCRLADACSYPYMFETPRPEGARRLRGARSVPHAYAFHGLEGPQVLATGAPLEFGLTRIGSAVESAPLVLQALRRAAERPSAHGRRREAWSQGRSCLAEQGVPSGSQVRITE